MHRADAAPGSRAAGGGGAPGQGGRLRQRRHGRVPLPAGRAALRVPRGQHPPAGRAPGHRADHRARPRQAAAARRRGRPAGGRAAADRGLRHRGPPQRRGPAAGVRPGAGHHRDRSTLPVGPGHPRRHRRRRGRRDPARVRLDDRQGHRPRPRPRRGAGPPAPGAVADSRSWCSGGTTNQSFLLDLLERPEVRAGDDRHVVARPAHRGRRHLPTRLADVALVAAALDAGELLWRRRASPTFLELGAAAAGRRPTRRSGATIELRHGGQAYRAVPAAARARPLRASSSTAPRSSSTSSGSGGRAAG